MYCLCVHTFINKDKEVDVIQRKYYIGPMCVIRAIYSRIYHVMPLCYNIDNIIRLLRLRLHITLKDFLLEVNRCYRVSKRRRLEQGK